MNTCFRQSGAVLLLAIIFLIVIGSAFAVSISNLATSSSFQQLLWHAGNVSLAAARSGLQYGVYQREQMTTLDSLILTYPASSPITTDCTITLSESPPATCAVSCYSTIFSSAYCYSSGDSDQVTRHLAMRLRGAPYTAAATAYSFQSIPGLVTTVTVSPSSGVAAGNTNVIISGIGFTGATAATFGGTAGTLCCDGAGAASVSDTQIAVTTPAHAVGAVDIVITSAAGTTITLPKAFTYY